MMTDHRWFEGCAPHMVMDSQGGMDLQLLRHVPTGNLWCHILFPCSILNSCQMCVLHISSLLWDVGVALRNFSRGWLDCYRWAGNKVCFPNWVNLVSGPLGGRSRKPNGLIREEGVDDRNEQQWEEPADWPIYSLMLQPLTAPRTCISPGRPLRHILGSLGRSKSLPMSQERFHRINL